MEQDEFEEPPETEEQDGGDVRDALERIAKDDPDGLLVTRAVVEAARDPESPLHKHIWAKSDEDAAYEHRLALARRLIVRYTLVRKDKTPRLVNAVVTTRGTDGESQKRQGWVPVERAAVDPDIYPQIVADARKGITAYRNRLSAFERAHTIVDALDEVVHQLDVQQQDAVEKEAA